MARDESGAVLILALVYLVSIALVVTALASWASNNLNNTTNFNAANELHYALSSATNTAIQTIRYAPLPSSTPTQKQATTLGNCWIPSGTPNSTLTINTYSVTVWCSTYEDNTSGATRKVTFYACLSSLTSSQCQIAPNLTAVVVFDDYPTGGGVLLSQQCNVGAGQCGYNQTLTSWIWK
ncbi:MAG TPA: hypothetical protein VGZ68_00345 [Acidimicrobiales bacterium]|jgi:hypothetical protein|nr:hypothetical protein [Acidimicrobiales bacterium]